MIAVATLWHNFPLFSQIFLSLPGRIHLPRSEFEVSLKQHCQLMVLNSSPTQRVRVTYNQAIPCYLASPKPSRLDRKYTYTASGWQDPLECPHKPPVRSLYRNQRSCSTGQVKVPWRDGHRRAGDGIHQRRSLHRKAWGSRGLRE